MTQKLYEEALADARKVTEVAENNAKQAVLEAVLPRIKRLIENELLGDMNDDDAGQMTTSDILTNPDTVPGLDTDAVSEPDGEGKVTLDLDALDTGTADGVNVKSGDKEFELNMESKNVLKALAVKPKNAKELDNQVKLIEQSIKKLTTDKKVTSEQISRMISSLENTYEYVQANLNESTGKKTIEAKLESMFQELNNIEEKLMKRMNEEEEMDLDMDASGDDVDLDSVDAGDGGNELTLKLTGLPADLDLDGVGVDLIGGDEDGSDDSGGEDDDVLDLDLDDSGAGDDDQGSDEEVQTEGDEIVEIDEGMLRKEIKRMAALRENAPVSTDNKGTKPGADEFDDFGGAVEEGEPLELGVELGDVTETRSKLRQESVRQNRIKGRMATLKREASRSRGSKLASIKENYRRLVKMLGESVKRSDRFRDRIVESSRGRSASKSRRSNSVVRNQQADKAVLNLRKKLAEANLQSVKLVYANKVLQSEALNPRQRAQVIKALDECNTPREAKLVYTSVVKRLSAPQRKLSENKVIGSGSQATRSGSSTVNEGFETERWSKLAGINK